MREAAARAQCQNNLKQLGLAILTYSDDNGALPSGTISHKSLPAEERLSWLVSLLPYLEQPALYKEFDEQNGWATEHNLRPAARRVKNFICPNQPTRGPIESWSRSSYGGIAGIGADAASLSLADGRCGVFGYERRTTMKDIKDGTSSTLYALETATNNGHWAAGGPATVRPIDPEQQPYLGANRPFGMDHHQPFLGSLKFSHLPAQTNAAMLDGSVRQLEASIHPRTLEALATIAGKERVLKDDF